MRNFYLRGMMLALSLGITVAPAAAQRKPTVAIMPSQFFSADAESATNLTQGLAQQFESQGYTVVGVDRTRSTFQSMGLSASQHYADSVAVRFGRGVGSDLVVYPRLLALGVPAASAGSVQLTQPAAVVLVRVLNVHTNAAIYARQIGHDFVAEVPARAADFRMPQPIATATAAEALEVYFPRVGGSAAETRGMQ
jgi:hypothetical protein